MRIFQEKTGKIGKIGIWICICEDFIYLADNLPELIKLLNTEWKHEKHMIG